MKIPLFAAGAPSGMEEPAVRVSWLNLHEFGLYRDLRKLIYAQLDSFDFALVQAAHLSSKPLTLDEVFALECAANGYLQLLIWARGRGCLWLRDETAIAAARGGFLDVLAYVCDDSDELPERLMMEASEYGHLPVVKWARARGAPWDEFCTAVAAEYGHLEVLQYLRKEGCPWDNMACSCAANGGHLHVLQWLRAQGCDWTEDVCVYAAQKGHFAVLKWAKENGCPMTAFACTMAAEFGHLEVLQFLHEQCGLPLRRVFELASLNHHEHVLAWLREHRCPES